MSFKIKQFWAYIKIMNFNRLYNLLLLYSTYFLSKFFNKIIYTAKPYAISIEPIVGCNLKCSGCELGAGMINRKKSKMLFEDYFVILNKIPKSVFHINLFAQGEPLLHDQIDSMLRIANEKRIYVMISTNGLLLNEEIANTLIKSKLDHIIISLDGHNSTSYEKYRIGGDFETVKKNIQTLVEAKKKLNSKFPLIEIQTVVLSYNEYFLDEIKKLSQKLKVDKFSIKTAYSPDLENIPEYLPNNPQYLRYHKLKDGTLNPKNKPPKICFRAWSSLVVQQNLDIVPCCYDKNADFILGNLKTQNFDEIIKSKTLLNLRKSLLTSENIPKMCNNCIQ